MKSSMANTRARRFIILALGCLLGACAEDAPLALPQQSPAASAEAASLALQEQPSATSAEFGAAHGREMIRAISALRRATARYHDLDEAIADGFVFLHGCENRPDEGPVGTVYVHMDRLLDGKIDPTMPEALIYEPARRKHGRPRLVGVELAVPYAMWTDEQPPRFLGHTFQPEDEFGVFGLHVWVWRDNPEGMFAESNPRVSCAVE